MSETVGNDTTTTDDPRVTLGAILEARIRDRYTAAAVSFPAPPEDLAIARDYLRQRQTKSVAQLTETVLLSTVGANVSPEIIASVTERLSFGRTAGPLND